MGTPTTTIRVPSRTYGRLKTLAADSGQPMSAVLEQALDRYERERFFEQLDAAFRDLRNDPAAWQEELAGRAAWESTLADGLTEE